MDDEYIRILDFLKEFREKRFNSMSPAEKTRYLRREADLQIFYKDREPVIMLCPNGKATVVGPNMDIDEIGTNVIPLPRRRAE